MDNIFNRSSDNVAQLTGPHGPVTKAVNEVFNLNNDENLEIYDCKDYFWKEIDTITDFNDMKKIIKNNKFKY